MAKFGLNLILLRYVCGIIILLYGVDTKLLQPPMGIIIVIFTWLAVFTHSHTDLANSILTIISKHSALFLFLLYSSLSLFQNTFSQDARWNKREKGHSVILLTILFTTKTTYFIWVFSSLQPFFLLLSNYFSLFIFVSF